jgi:hypothetical protein
MAKHRSKSSRGSIRVETTSNVRVKPPPVTGEPVIVLLKIACEIEIAGAYMRSKRRAKSNPA